MPILLGTGIIDPALRMAGITLLPGTTPNVDKRAELIPTVNRLLGSYNCNGHLIFSSAIDEYTLVASQKIYTIGPGGDFNAARPQQIAYANFIFPGSTQVRVPIRILDDDEWRLIRLQSIPGAPPWALYYDGSNDSNGRARIYISPQPPSGYILELYTWQALQANFTAVTDSVIFPPGYEQAIVTNLAIEACGLYPTESIVAKSANAYAALEKRAAKALAALITLNTVCPALRSEAAWLGNGQGSSGSGVLLGGTGGNTERNITLTGSITGTDGTDGNQVFTLSITPRDDLHFRLFKNGISMTLGVSYLRSGATIIYQSPQIPIVGDVHDAEGTA